MALTDVRPFGIRDLKVTPWSSAGTLGTAVDLPGVSLFKFKPTLVNGETKGDDTILAIHAYEECVEWELESGGLSLDARKAILGGTVTDAGTTPNQTKTYVPTAAGVQRPYFKIEGQALSEAGGDIHSVVYKCLCEDVEGGGGEGGNSQKQTFKGRAVAINAAEATALSAPAAVGLCYHFKQNETATAIS